MKNTLCENIKSLRLQNGMNQVEFAKKMCVTKQCVSNWENDNVLPSVEMLIKMADFFEVSTDFLLGRVSTSLLSMDGLTDLQQSHLRLLAGDLRHANQRDGEPN